MDPITLSIITSVATGYFVNFTSEVVKHFFEKAIELKPSIENDLQNAKTASDFDKVFNDAVGVIDASAGSGSIDVDTALLTAIKGIRFDHENGKVTIQGSTILAPILQTGGTGQGETDISDTNLKSQGTEIKVEKNAQIKITGNAKIKQS